MDNEDILGLFIIFFVLAAIALMYYRNFEEFQLKCIVSDVNGDKYCVRERTKIKPAADLLARVTDKCRELVTYMNVNYPTDARTKRLVKSFNPKKVMETLPTSQFTAYSENKGEKIAFCLNKKKGENEELIDESTLTFVAIHELSHVATLSIGHKSDFWENFKFLLEKAKEAGLHNPVDYKSNPSTYCGMDIHDNPYYDA